VISTADLFLFSLQFLFSGRLSEKKNGDFKKFHQGAKQAVVKPYLDIDCESLASTNISLLTVGSSELPKKEEYGVLSHYSPYEHLTNRFCRKHLINDFEELINTKLKHYAK
jgi:hypothetical protein